MLLVAAPGDRPGGEVERCEEGGGPVPDVVVGVTLQRASHRTVRLIRPSEFNSGSLRTSTYQCFDARTDAPRRRRE